MAEEVLLKLLNDYSSENLAEKFPEIFETFTGHCTIEEFAVYFLSFIRSQTEQFTKGNSSTCNTPKKIIGIADATQKQSLPYNNGPIINYGSLDTANTTDHKFIRRDLFAAHSPTTVNHGCSINNDDVDDDGDVVVAASPTTTDNVLQLKQQTTMYNSNRCHNPNDLYYERNENESKNAVSRKTSTNEFESDTAAQQQQQQQQRLQQPVSQHIYANTNVVGEQTIIIDEVLTTKKSCNRNDNSNGSNQTVKGVGVDEILSPILVKRRNEYGSGSPIIGAITSTSTPINYRTMNEHRKHNSYNSFDMPLHMSNDNNSSSSRKFTSTDHSKTFNTSRRNKDSSLCLGDFISVSTKSRKSNTSGNTSNPSPNTSADSRTSNVKDKAKATTATVVTTKPKRRVVPLTISKATTGRNEFTSSSFRSDNNLSNFMIEETEPGQGACREFIRTQRDSITRDFLEEQVPYKGLHASIKDKIIGAIGDGQQSRDLVTVDLAKVTSRPQILQLAQLYSAIIDMNLTTNILTEISFLINLLNAEITENLNSPVLCDGASRFGTGDLQSLFKSFNNCVFFALETLNYQRHLLAALDSTSIRVLLENERLLTFKQQLIEFLRVIHTGKVKMESAEFNGTSNGQFHKHNVFYQQESDTRDNFPSEKSFTAFRKQRDMFYSILRTWEDRHLDSTFNFQVELGAKVKSLLKLMEHPINMAHLSKLFAAQLIISCNFHHSTSELKMALPNIDLTKLSKLRQRLDAPSLFSTQYLFPGNQSFFRDFIECTENNSIFIHQLKLCLINELIEMNNSSYEIFNIEINGRDELHEYMVRPEFLSTMRILAKFIGFVVVKPFNYDDFGNNVVDSTQIQIRNNLSPEFDVKSILLKAICERKWIVTIPWVVQYLSMLDCVTLRLNYMKEVLYILYEFYINCAPQKSGQSVLQIPPGSSFILRSCLGWLFEQPSIPEEYFGYRQQRSSYSLLSDLQTEQETKKSPASLKSITVQIPADLESRIVVKSLTMTKCEWADDVLHCRLEPTKTTTKKEFTKSKKAAADAPQTQSPMFENLLTVACPFLADFRVSMMPSRVTKTISRSGRYRHITTKFSGDSSITLKEKTVSQQAKLIEEFLNSQSLSVKKTVEFVVERTTSAVVKDFQVDYILKTKRQTTSAIKQIRPRTTNQAVSELYRIYSAELKALNEKWDEEIPKMIEHRNEAAFDALLPKELLESVTRTCKSIAYQRTLAKVSDWRIANMNSIDLFCKNVTEEASKWLRSAQKPVTSNFTIDLNYYSPAGFFEQLQLLQHTAVQRPNVMTGTEVNAFLGIANECIEKQGLSHVMLRNTSFMVLQLLLLIICYRPDLITADLLDKFMEIFHIDKLNAFVRLPQRSAIKTDDLKSEKPPSKIVSSDYIFSNIMSPRYIQMLRTSERTSYDQFAQLLVTLMHHNFIDLNTLNNQMSALMKEQWPEAVNQKISCMYQKIVDTILLTNGCDNVVNSNFANLTIE